MTAGILTDTQAFACRRLEVATEAQVKEIKDAIREMNEMPSTLQDRYKMRLVRRPLKTVKAQVTMMQTLLEGFGIVEVGVSSTIISNGEAHFSKI